MQPKLVDIVFQLFNSIENALSVDVTHANTQRIFERTLDKSIDVGNIGVKETKPSKRTGISEIDPVSIFANDSNGLHWVPRMSNLHFDIPVVVSLSQS